MKRLIAIAIFSLTLSACQGQPALRSPLPLTPLRQQSADSPISSNGRKLPLSRNLQRELQQPDKETEPQDQSYNERLVAQILDPQYIHAHSYYFDFLDKDGQSSVESILRHDGNEQAANWVKNWRKVLSDGAVWPDHHSTTYNGPFTALEHGQVSKTRGWFMFRNASTKAEEYYRLAIQAWKPELAPDHPDQSEAWAWLGRTSHFVQDLTVPFHTRTLVRPAQALFHNSYEKKSEQQFATYLPSRNHNPDGVWANGGPYPAEGQWGLYYPAGTSAESMIFQLAEQSSPFYPLVNNPESSKTGNWEKSRSVLIPVGAKSTAGLVMAFLNEVGALK